MENGTISAIDLKKYQMKALGYDLLKERQILMDKLSAIDNELRNVQSKIKELDDIKIAQQNTPQTNPESVEVDAQDIDPSTGEVGKRKKK